jgi:hypothetical protein
MVSLIQRLLQLAVLVAIVYFIVNPQVLPQPAQSIAFGAQRFVFGNEVSLPSFMATWQEKWRYITTTIPVIGSWSKALAPEPTEITADTVMRIIIQTILVDPVNKWNNIKKQALQPLTTASITESTPSATISTTPGSLLK